MSVVQQEWQLNGFYNKLVLFMRNSPIVKTISSSETKIGLFIRFTTKEKINLKITFKKAI